MSRETLWATQAQIAEVFGVERSVVTKHIRNILKDGEIDEKSNVQKMHIANSDKPVATYSLDIILSTGYRTNSKIAIEFRKWALVSPVTAFFWSVFLVWWVLRLDSRILGGVAIGFLVLIPVMQFSTRSCLVS